MKNVDETGMVRFARQMREGLLPQSRRIRLLGDASGFSLIGGRGGGQKSQFLCGRKDFLSLLWPARSTNYFKPAAEPRNWLQASLLMVFQKAASTLCPHV